MGMKLFYYVDPKGNFGDDLNPWLWGQLIPELLDENAEQLLVGIGSILDHRLPATPVKHVLGSGVGYGNLPHVDDRYVFHAVRGHLTAKALGLTRHRVITDSAVLVRRAAPLPGGVRRHNFGFMTTGHSEHHYDWQTLCQELGFRFISCHWSVDRVLHEIGNCRTLISEAMHGAIVADALRVPWLPVALDKTVLPFKWKDWLSTLDLPYEPTYIASLYDNQRVASALGRFKNGVKQSLKQRGFWRPCWSSPFPLSTGAEQRERALAQLHTLTSVTPYLSDDTLIETLTVRYEEVLDKLKKSAQP